MKAEVNVDVAHVPGSGIYSVDTLIAVKGGFTRAWTPEVLRAAHEAALDLVVKGIAEKLSVEHYDEIAASITMGELRAAVLNRLADRALEAWGEKLVRP